MRYSDPNNPRNVIRVMPADPNSPHPSQQVPYIKYQMNGIFYDKTGKPVSNGALPEAHIPLMQFKQWQMPKFK